MFSQPSVMNHNFSKVPAANIPRSQFDRSHGFKTTFNSGYLVPVFVDEVLPGDTMNCQMTAFARLATPLLPFMDNLYLDSFFFFVPSRILWDNWEKFLGAQDNPGDSTDFLIPQVQFLTPVSVGSLGDYFGLPTGFPQTVNALPFRAYNKIWNEFFRDQNLQNSLSLPTDDGPDADTDYNLVRRGKRHDYFTSCLPWPQKGPSTSIPLGTSAPVVFPNNIEIGSDGNPFGLENLPGYSTLINASPGAFVPSTPGTEAALTFSGVGYGLSLNTTESNPAGVYADLNSATAATINSLRQAFAIQKLYERDARGGTRAQEVILAHFGVLGDDARLQRPEYLGGGETAIQLTPIAQTSEAGATPQANLAAFGTCLGSKGHGFVKSFVEFGYVIGVISVRADLNYQQGMNKLWSRQARFDFYWPALSHIGEQAVLNQEIYFQDNPTIDEAVFGYQERFAEYRYKPSLITGEFRSTYSAPLDAWHLAQDFGSLPTLGDTFIQDNPPVARVVADDTAPQFLLDCFFKYKCARPMPIYSVPSLIDHF